MRPLTDLLFDIIYTPNGTAVKPFLLWVCGGPTCVGYARAWVAVQKEPLIRRKTHKRDTWEIIARDALAA